MSFNDDFEVVTIEDLLSNALTPGRKVIEITGVTPGVSARKKTPYVRFAFRVVSSPDGDVGEEGTFDRYLTKSAAKILARDLHRIGLRGFTVYCFVGEGDPMKVATIMAEALQPLVNKRLNVEFGASRGLDGVLRNEVFVRSSAEEMALTFGGPQADNDI